MSTARRKTTKTASKPTKAAGILSKMHDIEDMPNSCANQYAAEDPAALNRALLDWYDAGHRSLPWRREATDPKQHADVRAYAVWVSEIMLQQTQVERVKEYYVSWMSRWPTVADLANASLEEVREAWQGLGYYRRARFLHEGAQSIVRENGGVCPTDPAGWKQVKGVGDYTAGAISSIAYGCRAAAVDGNVIRVFTRLCAVGTDPTETAASKQLWAFAESIMPADRPGDWNQALMELGATVCTPQSPRCGSCPFAAYCVALAEQRAAAATGKEALVTRFPCKPKKKPPRVEGLLVCVVQRRCAPTPTKARALGKTAREKTSEEASCEILMLQRPEETKGKASKLLAGLWEFPTVALPVATVQQGDITAKTGQDDACDDITVDGTPEAGDDGECAEACAKISTHAEALVKAREAMRALLVPFVGHQLPAPVAVTSPAEPVIHTFSHVQHRMHVDWLVLEDGAHAKTNPRAAGRTNAGAVPKPNLDQMATELEPPLQPAARWVLETELPQVSASNGMSKVFQAVRAARDEHNRPKAKAQKKKKAETDEAQRELSFFWRKSE